MDAATAALWGAGIGSTIPSVTSVVLHFQASKANRSDRIHAQRRDAYATLIGETRSYLASGRTFWRGYRGGKGAPPPDDALREVWEKLAPVLLYGTEQAGKTATAALHAVDTYLQSGKAEDYDAAVASIEIFVRQARADIEVDD